MRNAHVIVFAAVLGVASPAAAQSSREQLRASVRDAVENFRTVYYQQGREEQTDRQTRTLKLGPSYKVTPTPTLRAELEHVLGPAAFAAV